MKKLEIIAYLNKYEGGCDYSKHFKMSWIDNNSLHPFCKKIKVTTNEITEGLPEVYLLCEGVIIKHLKGSELGMVGTFSEFILKKYNS